MGWMFSHGVMMTPWNAFNNDAFQIKRGTAEVGFSGLWKSHVVSKRVSGHVSCYGVEEHLACFLSICFILFFKSICSRVKSCKTHTLVCSHWDYFLQGLNPLMFMFALVGNITYVGSILVRSTEWSQLKPNLPWLVDAGVCVLLDTFVSSH
jgi:hypothetical protein